MTSFFLTLDEQIVNINLHVPSNLLIEHLVYQYLVYCSYVLQSKWHEPVTVQSFTSDEGHFLLILYYI